MRFFTGILIWIAVIIAAGFYFAGGDSETTASNAQLVKYLTTPRKTFQASFDERAIVRIGDPVIVVEGSTARIVGHVTNNSKEVVSGDPTLPRWTEWAEVEFFSSAPDISALDYLSYHQTPTSMDWVVQMMLPPHKRQEIGVLITQAYKDHQSEIVQSLQPILLKSMGDATAVIKEDFYASVNRREGEIAALGNRYQEELVEQELIPMIKDEIWPIVQEESTPIATEIGEQMWQKASVWRFGWRMLYDQSPLPEKNLVNKEFQRFMTRYGGPIIESRLPDIMAVQQKVVRRASENEKVQAVVSEASMEVFWDPEFQTLVINILKDVFVDNDRLMAVFESNWKSPEAQEALQLTNDRLEPTVTKIGQALFGSPEESITPEFSRVLRNRILHKDDRWLVLHLNTDQKSETLSEGNLKVVTGQTGTENPFHVPARTKF